MAGDSAIERDKAGTAEWNDGKASWGAARGAGEVYARV